jgi:hypothetical protein
MQNRFQPRNSAPNLTLMTDPAIKAKRIVMQNRFGQILHKARKAMKSEALAAVFLILFYLSGSCAG